MRLNPQGGNDKVYTPDDLALRIVKHFSIKGKVLEPCSGNGSFLRAFVTVGLIDICHCEIDEGTDFFDFQQKVDWIVTNPPWSLMRRFLWHSYEIADDIVFFMPINHAIGLKARIRDMRIAGFGIKEVCLIDTPKEFPQSGFQLAAIHFQRNWIGSITISDL
jgi:hypothetical protein